MGQGSSNLQTGIPFDIQEKETSKEPKKEPMKEPKKDPQNLTIKLFKKCEMWENLVLLFFFANLILIWIFVTFYFLLDYIKFDFSS